MTCKTLIILSSVVLGSCVAAKSGSKRELVAPKRAAEAPVTSEQTEIGIVGGTPVNVPQIVLPGCTATIIGPYTVLSAGHCQQNGDQRVFNLNGESYLMTMINHPSFPYGNNALTSVSYDMSIGLTTKAIKGIQPFKIGNTSPTGGLFIYGYGCNNTNGTGYGTLRRGATDIRKRLYNGGVLEGYAGNNLCGGDSGGPVAGTSNNIYAVNSRGGVNANPSYYASTTTAWARSFFSSVATQYGVEICGVTSGGCGVTEICSYDFVLNGSTYRLAKSNSTCVSPNLNKTKLPDCTYSVNASGTPYPTNGSCFAPVNPFGARIGIDRLELSEGSSSNSATVTITLEQPAVAGGITFDLSSSVSNTVTFASPNIFIPAGQVTGTTTLTAIDNTVLDGSRDVTISFSTRTAGPFVKAGSVIAKINDNEIPYSYTSEPSSLNLSEDAATSSGEFSVVLNQPTYTAMTLYFQESPTKEYQLAATSIPVPIGAASVKNTITISDNKLVEGVRSITVNVSTTPNGPAVAKLVVQVTDNDRIEDVKWQNPSNRFDVSGDQIVTPLDVLQVINVINRSGPKALDAKVDASGPPYIDVNGDGAVTPLDVLQVINELNRRKGL